MMNYIPNLINAAVLIYGGIVDYKRREIPNTVPAVLLLSVIIFGFSTFWSIMGLILPATLFFIAAKLTKSDVPGGDFKLVCALGFACGLPELAAILLLAGSGAAVCGLLRRLPMKRHIPLCTYVAPAYVALRLIALALGGGGSM